MLIKIYNPNISKQTIGGGWSFKRNIEKGLADKIDFINSWMECDIFLISSLTIVDKTEVFEAYKAGKKIVLRVDNMPRKSRNRRMSPAERMKEYADMASAIIYQSQWAKDWIGSYLGHDDISHVILNGTDLDIFKPMKKPEVDYKKFLIIQYNRDENKRMPEAFDMFSAEWIKNKKNKLWVIGNFSHELFSANFDLWRGEKAEYFGIADRPEVMADYMQQADILLYPSYSDACPNTVIESLCCGMEVWHKGFPSIVEIMDKWQKIGRDYFSLNRMTNEYLEVFKNI